MRFFFYLILLSCIFVDYSLTINDNDYILCTSIYSQITVSFSEPLTFPPEYQENNNFTNIYDYALVCGIEYRINYDDQQIHINFKATNDTNSLENPKSSEYFVQTIWLNLAEYRYQPNEVIRKYHCNTNKDCAKNFYLNTINYLVNDGKEQLDLIKIKLHNESLLIGPQSRRRCTDSTKTGDKTSVSCKYGLCFVRYENYELNETQNSKKQNCELENKAILFSEIEYHQPKSKEKQLLEYKCNKNVCNRDGLFLKIQDIINEYTKWEAIKIDNKSINEKQGSLSIKQTISSYILVLFLIFIQLFI